MDEVERLEKLEKKLRNRKRIMSAILGAGSSAILGSKYGPAGALGGLYYLEELVELLVMHLVI